uniref:Uncharacterized protein n=1 Tax=Helianthus annuus TaxID=4232 RepID=A0A251SXN7_HELAN
MDLDTHSNNKQCLMKFKHRRRCSVPLQRVMKTHHAPAPGYLTACIQPPSNLTPLIFFGD